MTEQKSGAGLAAVVTGASSGIGHEIARLLARDGYRVYLIARDAERLAAVARALTQVYGADARALPIDLSLPGASERVHEAVAGDDLPVGVLINNAGFSVYGPFLDTDWEAQSALLQVNIVTLTTLTRLFLPTMAERRAGRIMNVASTAAFFPGPLMACYYASKAYVLSFSEALQCELEGSGVTVTALCPGITASGFQKRAGMESSRLMQSAMMSSQAVAEIGYRGMQQGEGLVIPGAANKGVILGPRILPRRVMTRMVRRLQEPEE